MAWRCRFLTARPSQDGRAIAENAPDALVDFHTEVGLVERRLDALVAFGRRVELHGLIAALRRRARGRILVAESQSVRVHAPPRAEGLVRGEAMF